MQKSKSLLIKLFSVLCIICCALALVFGISACSDGKDGNNGSDGADGVGIVKVEVDDNGDVWVTYTNSSTPVKVGSVNVSGGTTACDHKFTFWYDIDAAVCATEHDGQKLSVCDNCGYAKIEAIAWAHDWEPTTVVPTCTTYGYTTLKCKNCDAEQEETDEVPATGHTLGVYKDGEFVQGALSPATIKGADFCLDGGLYLQVCKTCGEIVYNSVNTPIGHHTVLEWSTPTTENLPTEDAEGEVHGTCAVCGAIRTLTLPKLGDSSYSIDGKRDCTKATELTYTYTAVVYKAETDEDGNVKYVESTQDITFKATESATGHHYDGNLIYTKDYVDATTGEPYYYEGANEAELKAQGLWFEAGSDRTCKSGGFTAAFICQDCEELVYVNARISHKALGEDASEVAVLSVDEANKTYTTADGLTTDAQMSENVKYIKAASCEGEGTKGAYYYICETCEEVVTVVIPVPEHDYKYTVKENKDGSVTITGKCNNCSATTTPIIVEKDKVTVEITKEATCTEAGEKTYTVVGYGTFTEAIPIGHRYNNTLIYATSATGCWVDEDGNIVPANTEGANRYYYEGATEAELKAKGLYFEADSTRTCESGGFKAAFICQYCEELVYVDARLAHTAPEVAEADYIEAAITVTTAEDGTVTVTITVTTTTTGEDGTETTTEETVSTDNNKDNKNIYIQKATCEQLGYKVYFCQKCGELQYTQSAKTDHEYTVDGIEEQEDGTYEITIVCKNDCGYTKTYPCTSYDFVVDTAATCTETGVGHIEYTYTDDDEKEQSGTITNVTIPVADHAVSIDADGEFVRLENNITTDTDGEEVPTTDEDGKYILYSTTTYPELIPISGIAKCGSTVQYVKVAYICAQCDELTYVFVSPAHNTPTTQVTTTTEPTEDECKATPTVAYVYQPDCTKDAVLYYWCSRCSTFVHTETLAGTEGTHSYEIAVTTVPTATTAGTLTVTCSKGDIDAVTITVPALNSTNYTTELTADPETATTSYYIVLKEATCVATGSVKYVFVDTTAITGYTITKSWTITTATTGHTLLVKDGTLTAVDRNGDGVDDTWYQVYTCTVCSASEAYLVQTTLDVSINDKTDVYLDDGYFAVTILDMDNLPVGFNITDVESTSTTNDDDEVTDVTITKGLKVYKIDKWGGTTTVKLPNSESNTYVSELSGKIVKDQIYIYDDSLIAGDYAYYNIILYNEVTEQYATFYIEFMVYASFVQTGVTTVEYEGGGNIVNYTFLSEEGGTYTIAVEKDTTASVSITYGYDTEYIVGNGTAETDKDSYTFTLEAGEYVTLGCGSNTLMWDAAIYSFQIVEGETAVYPTTEATTDDAATDNTATDNTQV